MKKILWLLLVVFFASSCSVENELVQFENVAQLEQRFTRDFGEVESRGEDMAPILLEFNDRVSVEQINLFRTYYENYFGMQSYYRCTENSKSQVWLISYVQEDRFWVLVNEMPDLPTTLSDPDEGDIGTVGEFVTFYYDSICF